VIEKTGWGTCEEFTLICDNNCGEFVEGFTEFDDAVKYKRPNGWTSVKSDSDNWYELCPDCSTPETIEEYRRK
jgi:hypothetical protein